MNDAELAQAEAERRGTEVYDQRPLGGKLVRVDVEYVLPARALGERNPATGHLVIDQKGHGEQGSGDVVLAWRERDGKADYAVWRLFVTHDGRRGFDAGWYFDGQGALARAAEAFRAR